MKLLCLFSVLLILTHCAPIQKSNDVIKEAFENSFSQKPSLREFLFQVYKDEFLKILDESEYCVRKYIVEKKLIETSYKINLNPRDINTTEINCDKIIKDIF